MADFILQCGITRLNISLDAATPETYKAVRGGDLDLVEKNIKYILDNRDKDYGPLVRVSFCIQDINQHEKEMFRDKWEPKVDSVEFQDLHTFENLEKLETGNVLFEDKYLTENKKFCYSPFSYLAIWSDGTVSPCCTFHGQKLSLGNINSPSTSLSGIWKGTQMTSLRKQFNEGKLNSVCEDCLSCTNTGN